MEWLLLVVGGAWLTILALKSAGDHVAQAADNKRSASRDLSVERSRIAADQVELQRRLVEVQAAQVRLGDFEARLRDPNLTPRALYDDVASAIADFSALQMEILAAALESKKHPARRAADEVRELAQRVRELQRELKTSRYTRLLYERCIPWIADYLEDEIPLDPVIEEATDMDPGRQFLSGPEWASLSAADKYQLALDRYWKTRKHSWQLGRDYERYIGYLWEMKGYQVQYHGIEAGLEDLGRDLIATKGEETVVIQCKWWSSHKVVRERHIYQLFGTSIEHALSLRASAGPQQMLFPELLPAARVTPIFITSTSISDKARQVASVLGVEVQERIPMACYPAASYPCIKCNVSRSSGERIYHLPFDQLYDKILIEPDRGEMYVERVADAEALGFRRAWRWRGTSQ